MTKAERIDRDRIRLVEMKSHEDELRLQGCRFIAGIDEAGRGPLAGPVYAACVVLPSDWDFPGINDSKKLSAKKREELDAVIREKAEAYAIGIADSREIDEINILEATKQAMRRASDECNRILLEKYDSGIDIILADAVKLDIGIPCEPIIKGDEKCLSIAAASIVAKVARDSYMTEMDEVYPGYDFAGNKGYGTTKHYEGLRAFGYTPIHRRSFLRKFEASLEMSDNGKEMNSEVSGRKSKIYAVRKGRSAGIFTTWDDCRKQVDGYPGAEYKSFGSIEDACSYLGISVREYTGSGGNSTAAPGLSGTADKSFAEGVRAYVDGNTFAEGVSAYVDGSYDAATGRYSCGVVMIKTDAAGNTRTRELKKAFDDPESAGQRNVAGEIMGSRMAIDFCLANRIDAVTIYHDYEGIGKWADGKWKANNPLTQGYRDYVARARAVIKIDFVKVTAHSGNKYNDIADRLAKSALKEDPADQ